VAWPRPLRRALLAVFLSSCSLVFLALATSQIEQRIFRRRAERLLAELQALELRKTPWPDAQRQFRHWGANAKLDDHCNAQECSVEIALIEPVYAYVSHRNLFSFLDDYLRWRLKLSYDTGPFVRAEGALFHAYLVAGGRPARVAAHMGMREGIVWNKGFWVYLETYAHSVPDVWEGVYGLYASTYSVPRFDRYDSRDPQLLLHSNYVVGRPDGCEICVAGWAKFTPYTNPDDAHRLMRLDLSCLTRVHPCRTQQDIMPDGWTQYLAERQQVDGMWGQKTCSAPVIEMLGRDGANIIRGEIASYKEEHDGKVSWRGHAGVKLLEKLKGGGNWKVGDTHEMGVFRRADQTIRPGDRFILVFDERQWFDTVPYDTSSGCSPLPLNQTNLDLVLRGIGQDYTPNRIARDQQWHW
jgi:hypothetical protein